MSRLKLGTRGSNLALRQADLVAQILKSSLPDIVISYTIIKTAGDKLIETPLAGTAGKGFFTKEIERELLAGHIDIAVHSLKDLPTCLEPSLCIGAVLKRENPLDVLLSAKGYTFETLPRGATLGTSSLRRTALVKAHRRDIRIEPLRGNIETRIKKMHEQELDGAVLAYAGVQRLGLVHMITEMIPPEIMLPAPGQGALAVEARDSDQAVLTLLNTITDQKTGLEVLAERTFLHTLHGGCQVPVGCMAQLRNERLFMQGLIASPDGTSVYRAHIEGSAQDAASLGEELALRLLGDGGRQILENILNT